jgi:adenylate cyclase class 2
LIEVEIKAKVSDPDSIREKFKSKDGKYIISLHHEDTYFNMPEKLRDFRKTDEALRIRKSIESEDKFESSEKKINYYLTYKGKKLDSLTKTRKELEISVSSGEIMKDLLNSLGFREVLTVVKERELYKVQYKDKVIIALIDYIPILNEWFIEVELITESTKKLEDSRELLFEFLNSINIKREESIRKSYLELIVERKNIRI